MLSCHNDRFLEQHDNAGIKGHSHHHLQNFKSDYYHHRNINHKQSLSYMILFISLMIVSFFSPSKVSALNDRLVIVEPSSRMKIASPTHSFISELSTKNPVIREYFDRSLDKDVNRLVDRSENIIKIQDEEESQMIQSKAKPPKDSKDFRWPLQLYLEHGLIGKKDSRIEDTINVGRNPRYKLIGPSRITCTTLQYLSKTVIKWDPAKKQFCKKQLKSMYRCKFSKKKDVCRGLLAHYYFNLPRLKCKLYHFRNCYSSAKQFTLNEYGCPLPPCTPSEELQNPAYRPLTSGSFTPCYLNVGSSFSKLELMQKPKHISSFHLQDGEYIMF